MTDMDSVAVDDMEKEHLRISKVVQKADDAYHSSDRPIIDDDEYDSLKRRLVEIESMLPHLKANSPTGNVGAKPRKGFAKVAHASRMMSLGNAFTPDEVREFVAQVAKATGTESPRFVGELKIDGLSLSLIFREGALVRAATRGDSEVGDDVTDNVRGIAGIPATIPYTGDVEVRGEAYMTHAALEELNARLVGQGLETYANVRNAAAGALRNQDPKKARSKYLHFFGYSIIEGPAGITTQEEVLATLDSWGIAVSDQIAICDGAEQLIEYQAYVASIRKELPFDIDGVVYKLDDLSLRESVGETSRAPKWAIAHKFEAEKVTTTLLDITVQVGRTGVITPVAELRPVSVGGVTISRATLHNAEELLRKDIRIGDTVTVQRAGDVIPQVLGIVPALRPGGAVPYVFPKSCPSCGGILHRSEGEVAIRCVGAFSCPAQKVERLIYLASREVLNVDGLGEKAVEAFVNAGILDRPGDVFRLRGKVKRIAALDGMADKTARALADAADKSRNAPLDRFLAALGIRFVGQSTARLLAAHAQSVGRFLEDAASIAGGDRDVIGRYLAIEQVGQSVIDAVAEHFSDQRNLSDAHDLASVMQVEEHVTVQGPLTGKTVVFTGSLDKFDRNSAKESAIRLGAKVSGSVSKKTYLVVAGPGAGTKLEDAKKHGVEVIDEAKWISIVEAAGISIPPHS